MALAGGELSEGAAWRGRIDTTTNWAVVFSVTTLSFVFADKNSERYVLIPIVSVFCTFLLLMETRRYRFFDIWRSRSRMIEINFCRPMLDDSALAMKHWAETLAHDMNWKFSSADLKERGHWDEYQAANEEVFNHTSTKWAPQYVVSADNKWFTRLAVAAVICNILRGRKLAYPTVDEEKKQNLLKAKAELEANGGPLDPKVDRKAKKQEFQEEREGRETG